ncbi:MAG: hypothetical protein LLF99_00290, partial [Desulfobacteraceae bacterium]|nr:hypothetical protein [Desulfobacteraceae bacterium]
MSDHPRFSVRSRRPGAFFLRLIPVFLCLLLVPPVVLAASAPEAKSSGTGPLKLVRVTPSGEDVPAGKQIVFEFDRPVVPLGRMERSESEVPVQFEPKIACEWRWLNPSTLSCRLPEKSPLAPATRYTVTVLPGLKAQDGTTMAQKATAVFITERPKITGTTFKTWAAPGTPQIAVRFNQAVQEASVAARVFFQVKNGQRAAATVTEDPNDAGYSTYRKGFVWLLSPQNELPQDADVDLRVEPGLLSASGAEPSIENRSVTVFHTFPAFRFLGVRCRNLKGEAVFIPQGAAGQDPPRCNPLQPVSLVFSSPVMNDALRGGVRISPPPVRGEDEDIWESVNTYSRLYGNYSKGYPASLPWWVLKPDTEYQVSFNAAELKDEFGRPLTAATGGRFRMDHRPPDFHLFKDFPVIEKDLDTDVPVLATNLEELKLQYEVYTEKGMQPPKSKNLGIPKTRDVESYIPLGLRGLVPGASGLIRGRLSSRPEVKAKQQAEKEFYAQITPFHMHAKVGHHNTLVWVTDMKTGAPVPGVRVEIFKDSFRQFGAKPVVLSRGETSGDGTVRLAGTSLLDPGMKMQYQNKPEDPLLFVSARKGSDMALMPLRYDFEAPPEVSDGDYIRQERASVHGHVVAWGATAQGIYRAGDTVQYKIYVRDQDNLKFVAAPRSEYTLKVMDPMEKVVHERRGVMLSDFGAFSGEFRVPGNGAVGWYRFDLSANFSTDTWEPLRLLVSDFTPSPFKVAVDLHGDLFRAGEELKATTRATMHAGGPFANAGTRLSALVESRPLHSQNAKARDFQFDTFERGEEYERPGSQTIHQSEGKLDGDGLLETSFSLPETNVLYGSLTFESAVKDERGKSVANRASAVYAGRDRYVGLRLDEFTLQENRPAAVRAIVVDERGEPVAGVPVEIRVDRRETKASRVKGAGNAYVTQYSEEWIEVAVSAGLVSTDGAVEFSFTPKRSGVLRITAGIQDTKGRPASSKLTRYV